jgi:hypothetical protein
VCERASSLLRSLLDYLLLARKVHAVIIDTPMAKVCQMLRLAMVLCGITIAATAADEPENPYQEAGDSSQVGGISLKGNLALPPMSVPVDYLTDCTMSPPALHACYRNAMRGLLMDSAN